MAARLDELVAERASAETRDADALEQIRLAVATARNDLVGALEAVAERVGALESRPEPDAADGSELSALREELAEDLREGLAGITMQAPTAEAGWAEEAALLGERIDGLSELVAGALAAVPGDPARPAERPAAPERSDGDTEGELERLRMAIERMGMHLGAQERAIAEVMRSRGVAQRLDELEARIEDVAAGAAAGGGGVVTSPDGVASAGGSADARALARRLDAAEAALEAEREKMFAKLDRMGSAIDWRLQRLEAAGTE